MTKTPQQILKSVFGFDQFRPLQEKIIENILSKKDSLGMMPTGGGKSLCYQLPALIFSGLTVVVSPLIALMKDQVEQLQALGVPAVFLNSSLSIEEYQENMKEVRQGKIKLLYVAPETLLTPRLFTLLQNVRVDCLTIDEAHCISEWGHDFRPEYRQLVEVRRQFPDAVCLALTATATPRVREDIMKNLGFEASNEFIASFNRGNLFIEVQSKIDPLGQTMALLSRFPGQSGIIYCFSRKGVETLSAALQRRGYSVRPYHAGLEDAERKRNQEAFIRDDVQIIIATIAFGMGINKPNVRFILHYDLPKSIESYYQEIGRAGRDGLPAHCLLLYSYGDSQKLKYFIHQKEGTEREVALSHLEAMVQYAEGDICRRTPLLAYFGEKYTTDSCEMCDNCLEGERDKVDLTVPAQKFLSCVKRTGERFGAAYVTDVLLGSQNQKISKYGHQEVSTYGIGKELNRDQWLHLSRQLVQKGLLEQDERYGSLRLTTAAYELLRSRETVYGFLLETKEIDKPGKKSKKHEEYDQELFEKLRAKRKELADAEKVPPYIVFSDRTLVEMATYYPQGERSLRNIHGVGQVKLERYGEIFLQMIKTYSQAKGLQEKPKQSGEAVPAGQMELRTYRHMEVGEAYNSGRSIEELMEVYGVQRSTILDHLARYAQEGRDLRASNDFWIASSLLEDKKTEVVTAFADLGTDYLRPVFERMNGEVDYDQLKLLRLHYLSHLA